MKKNLRDDIPVEVEEIVLKAMSKDREDRYRSMTEMATAAAQASGRMTRPTGDQPPAVRTMTPAPNRISIGDAPPITDPDLSEIRRGSSRLIVVALVVALVLAGALVYAFVLRDRGKDPGGGQAGGTATAQDDWPSIAGRFVGRCLGGRIGMR